MKRSKFLALLLVCVGVLFMAAQAMAVDYSSSGNGVSVIEFFHNVVDAGKNDPEQAKSLLTAYNIRNLIEHDKANINVKVLSGHTLLMAALMYGGNPEIIKMLLDAGADVNAKDNVGATVLMKSLKRHNPAIVRMLLNAGANVNDRNPETGLTPLMIAANVGTPEVVEMLFMPERM